MRIRRVSALLLALCLLPAMAMADTYKVAHRLREDMPSYLFSLEYGPMQYTQAESDLRAHGDEDSFLYVRSITVAREDNGAQVQRIDLNPAAETYDDETLGFMIEDMNFDGYADMRTMQYVSAGVNIIYHCWLWSPSVQQFVYSVELSAIPSPMFDAATGEVHGFSIAGDAEYVDTAYRFSGDTPVMVSRRTTGYDFESGVVITTIEQLVEGQMVVTSVSKEPFMLNDEGSFTDYVETPEE